MTNTFKESDLAPENGWAELPLTLWQSHAPSFVSGNPSGDALRVRYYRRDADGALVGKAWFGPGTQGPPGHGHGGSMAALLDEVMGAAAWLGGFPVLAASITVDFRKMIPLRSIVVIEARVTEVSGRKVTTEARLHDSNGDAYAEGKGLFISLGGDSKNKVFESWKTKAEDVSSSAGGNETISRAIKALTTD